MLRDVLTSCCFPIFSACFYKIKHYTKLGSYYDCYFVTCCFKFGMGRRSSVSVTIDGSTDFLLSGWFIPHLSILVFGCVRCSQFIADGRSSCTRIPWKSPFVPIWLLSLAAQRVKRLPPTWETRVRSLGREDPWRSKWQPTPVFLSGKFHGQRSLAGYSPWGHKELNTT